MNVLPNITIIYDENGYYTEILAPDDKTLVGEVKDLIGHSVYEKMPQKAADETMSAIRRVIETGTTQVIEYQMTHKDGRNYLTFEGRLALVEKDSAGHARVVKVEVDISERVKLFEQIQRIANRDPLTGCFNRRHFFTLAEQEVQRAKRYQRPLSLIMIDVDHFKNVNDTYGHQTGDVVLYHLCDAIQKSIRSVDLLARYGGEEFIVLFPETPKEKVNMAAEKLQTIIRKLKIPTATGEVGITVSMGIAGLDLENEDASNIISMISDADRGLYEAKEAGRNTFR